MKKLILVTASIFLLFATSAYAADFHCDYTPNNIFVYADGNLSTQVPGTGGWLTLCNVSSVLSGVTTASCNAWYSMLLTAKATGQEVQIFFHGTSGIPDCGSLPNWGLPGSSSLAPFTLLIRNP